MPGATKLGFPPVLTSWATSSSIPAASSPLPHDFSAQIAAYKKEGVEIVTGVVPIPPDFINFWNQAHQQGFQPEGRLPSARRYSFPSRVDSLGDLGNDLSHGSVVDADPSVQVLADRRHLAADLADGYEAATGTAMDAADRLRPRAVRNRRRRGETRRRRRRDKAIVRDAIVATNLDTIVGHDRLEQAAPMKNVCKTPLVGGPVGTRATSGKYDLIVVANTEAPEIPVAARSRSPIRVLRTGSRGRHAAMDAAVCPSKTVSKSFGALKVTDDLSLRGMPKGEALGIIGPNGAGKTTLFNLITGGPAPDLGDYPVQRQEHDQALVRIGAAARASAAPTRSPCRSRA